MSLAKATGNIAHVTCQSHKQHSTCHLPKPQATWHMSNATTIMTPEKEVTKNKMQLTTIYMLIQYSRNHMTQTS
jgi:hypothetical protein